MKTGEFALIERLKKHIPVNLRGLIGIGDDGGVIRMRRSKESLVISTDLLVEGVDFNMRSARPEWVGRKALAVNLSDLAAMAAQPLGFVIALGLPASLKESWLDRFYRGMMSLARKYRVACLGGDLSRAREFSAAITVIGETDSPKRVLRSGLKTGDWLGVTGTLGGSILGRQFHFEPRLKEAQWLSRHGVHAMIDLSDGLIQDLGHLLHVSRKGARIDLDQIPVSRDALRMSGGHYENAFKRALSDGEDFELLFSASDKDKKLMERLWPRKFPRVSLSWIGRITRGKGISAIQNGRGVSYPLSQMKGYRHF